MRMQAFMFDSIFMRPVAMVRLGAAAPTGADALMMAGYRGCYPRLMSIAPPAHGSRVMLKLRPRLMSHAPSVLCARDMVRKNRRLMSIAASAHSDASQSGEYSAFDPGPWTLDGVNETESKRIL